MQIKGKIVEVIWVDAALESAQLDMECATGINPIERCNAGYCIHSDDKKLIIVFGLLADIDKKKQVCDQILVIPKVMVKSCVIRFNKLPIV